MRALTKMYLSRHSILLSKLCMYHLSLYCKAHIRNAFLQNLKNNLKSTLNSKSRCISSIFSEIFQQRETVQKHQRLLDKKQIIWYYKIQTKVTNKYLELSIHKKSLFPMVYYKASQNNIFLTSVTKVFFLPSKIASSWIYEH